ncbi:MAG: hypothetical protein D4R80_07445 [Deltaproteobacteria bacterium]|nr:MAG: hypothetical protein D4R80_07445 [Deltaproteobacteria bacterium]
MKRVLILFLSASILAGCSSGFVYQRKPVPAQEGPVLPVKVAVVAFQDGTEDFTSRGNIIAGSVFNLARTDINGLSLNSGAAFSVSSLPAAQWSKSLAEDMDASGAFRSVKFVFGPSEVTDEEIVVEGVLTKANFTTIDGKPDEFLLHLKLRRMPGGAVVREGDVGRNGIRPPGLTSGCFGYGGCVIDRIHGYLNGVMQGIFADIRRDLVLAFSPPPAKKPDVPGQESPEEVIKNILGKQ